ncbi:uncharacterized protein PV09_01353 [Verruconis gallopava]|uniref:Uncharacterized protein n=1 Tax=Verruconis gallopava TaxID=253628 RepID=A0A0D2API4_9PEZI|nr:uncharacterized protein PV09_01353 [Verruconis gallopava]KIW08450.1 hypothetical protein PV09_01353 [Verruconis gallopava]
MAERKQQSAAEDDWEEVHASEPDDTISLHSETETETVENNQHYVEVDGPKKTTYPGRIYQDPNEKLVGSIPTLRRSLYNLKDTLSESIEQLEDFNQEYASMEALSISVPIKQLQEKQVNALSILLTNSGTDWEVSVLQGGMSFDEFAELDPVSIDELCRIMKDFVHEVRAHKYARKKAADYDEDEDNADVAFLDFILPAVDEISLLLRIDEGSATKQHDNLSGPTLLSTTKENCGEQETEPKPKDDHDQIVHERMMMASDW